MWHIWAAFVPIKVTYSSCCANSHGTEARDSSCWNSGRLCWDCHLNFVLCTGFVEHKVPFRSQHGFVLCWTTGKSYILCFLCSSKALSSCMEVLKIKKRKKEWTNVKGKRLWDIGRWILPKYLKVNKSNLSSFFWMKWALQELWDNLGQVSQICATTLWFLFIAHIKRKTS